MYSLGSRFTDLALALAHDARTKQLLAISRGEPPPSLNTYQARLSPLASLDEDEEAELLFSGTLHHHLSEYDLAQYTIHNQSTDHNKTPQLKPNASAKDTPSGSRKRDQPKKNTDASKRPVGSQWEP
eukprot:scaffold14791_cov131-Isochrysis_galbana.AAC.4